MDGSKAIYSMFVCAVEAVIVALVVCLEVYVCHPAVKCCGGGLSRNNRTLYLTRMIVRFVLRCAQDPVPYKPVSIPVMDMQDAEESWKTCFHSVNSKNGCIIGTPGPGKRCMQELFSFALTMDLKDNFRLVGLSTMLSWGYDV